MKVSNIDYSTTYGDKPVCTLWLGNEGTEMDFVQIVDFLYIMKDFEGDFVVTSTMGTLFDEYQITKSLIDLLKLLKKTFPKKLIYFWSSERMEHLLKDKKAIELLQMGDIYIEKGEHVGWDIKTSIAINFPQYVSI